MSDHVKSSPHLFRPIKVSLLFGLVLLFVLVALLPAPLEAPADPARPPNPAKSAWFLIWVQELVSYGTPTIYVVLSLAAILVALPWLPLPRLPQARWFPREHWPVVVAVMLTSGLILALTVVGLFLRGPDWRLVPLF